MFQDHIGLFQNQTKFTKQISYSSPTMKSEEKLIYIYALVVIDIASRYVDVEALTSKSSDEVSNAFKKIYSRK